MGRRDDTDLVVAGKVKNNDNTTLKDPTVCIVVYTDDDNVVIVGKDESLSNLDEDDTDTFSITLTVPDSTTTVDHVDVYVDGLVDDVPILPESDTNNSVDVCDATNTPNRRRRDFDADEHGDEHGDADATATNTRRRHRHRSATSATAAIGTEGDRYGGPLLRV